MIAGGVSRLRRLAKRLGFSCASISGDICLRDPPRTISSPEESARKDTSFDERIRRQDSNLSRALCTICLEPLTNGGTDEQAIFTAQCMHSFHFICIASNVRHGSITCPICRAQWTQLPRGLTPCQTAPSNQSPDPVLTILDESIANFRVNRRSLHPARYNDDDPIEPGLRSSRPRLQLSLIPIPLLQGPEILADHHPCCNPLSPRYAGSSSYLSPPSSALPIGPFGICLSIRLSHQQPTDMVLVVSLNGPHMRLLKQSMALVVFSLRPVDRLAIVICSSGGTRALPLRRMTSNGKQTALQVIDRLFYLGDADPTGGLRKGVKILQDRSHQNPLCALLHLSDSPTRAYMISQELEIPFPIHHFHVGFGFGASNGFVMHEFDEFLLRMLGGMVREAQLRIGKDGGVIRLGELRVGEERRIPLGLVGDCGCICVGYSYIECGVEEFLRTGEMVVGVGEKGKVVGEGGGGHEGRGPVVGVEGRPDAMKRWDYMDPFMARRWAKHLHAYRG